MDVTYAAPPQPRAWRQLTWAFDAQERFRQTPQYDRKDNLVVITIAVRNPSEDVPHTRQAANRVWFQQDERQRLRPLGESENLGMQVRRHGSGAAIKGRSEAPLAIVEYSEFQCPYCADFVRDALPSLARAYLDTGKAFLVFRHLPLESIHPLAAAAAVAAECAGRQGSFWQMHDNLFGIQRELKSESFLEQARTLGLAERPYAACVDSPDVLRQIRSSAADARKMGIGGTPTFLIGRVQSDGTVKAVRRVSGAQPFSVFDDILRSMLETR